MGVSWAHQAEDGVVRRTCVNTKMNPWGFLKCEKCVNQISDCRLLKGDSD